eukprot:7562863-Pyramimonas_sp.AAC.1
MPQDGTQDAPRGPKTIPRRLHVAKGLARCTFRGPNREFRRRPQWQRLHATEPSIGLIRSFTEGPMVKVCMLPPSQFRQTTDTFRGPPSAPPGAPSLSRRA